MAHLILLCTKITRAVRGSDYSPATGLSEEKDKLVTENWKDREKNRSNFGECDVAPVKTDKVNKVEK